MRDAESKRILLGRISGLFGLDGWVRVFSYTEPRDGVLSYSAWQVGNGEHWQPMTLEAGRAHGKGVVAKLRGCDDRDAARRLVGRPIAVSRSRLPKLTEGEYYWVDLVGCRVVNEVGVDLGEVAGLLETGANDVLVVEGDRQRLIPFVLGDYVTQISLGDGLIRVVWDPDF